MAVELRESWRRYKVERDQESRERLVLDYSPLVESIAARMAFGLPAHVEESDLVSYGLLGLIDAIERFDPDREIEFEAFAASRVRGAILDELRALDWAPRSLRTRAREVERARSALAATLGRVPSDEEVACRLLISVDELRGLLFEIANSSVLALDEPATPPDSPDGAPSTTVETIGDPTALDPEGELQDSEFSERIADAVESLPERERLVIALRYYEGLPPREISELLGVTESRVSQLHGQAVTTLRSRLRP